MELSPYMCESDEEYNRLLNESLELYSKTFLGEGSIEQPVEKIRKQFSLGNQKILVNLKTLPNKEKCGVAATAIICMLENENFCHLDYLCVNSEYRGNGIGSIFMTQFVIPYITRDQYMRNLTLECIDKLIRWYIKLGAKLVQDVPSSQLGDSPVEFSLLCFSSVEAEEVTQAQAQDVLFEIRRRFHGMSEFQMVEKMSMEDDVELAGSNATSELNDQSKVKLVYKWIMDH